MLQYPHLLFSQEKYLEAHGIVDFRVKTLKSSTDCLSATFVFTNDQGAISLLQAPYGGMILYGKLKHKEAWKQTKRTKRLLDARGLNYIHINQQPVFTQHADYAELHDAFKQGGFRVSHELNYHINLRAKAIPLHDMQFRRIKKCIRTGFVCRPTPLDQWEEVYEFICRCRLRQGLTINIKKERFETLLNQLPEHYKIYTVRDEKGQLAGATVLTLVNHLVAYNYLPAFDRAYSAYSPLAFLLHYLYSQLADQGFAFFDLGLASIQGQPQADLARFKSRMGGICTQRFSYLLERPSELKVV